MKKVLYLLIVGLFIWSMECVAGMRRPISPIQPMWLVHIDSWNYPDPQKIIDLVPADVRPYVVFNISLSSNNSVTLDGKRICDSWMKVCARNRVWTMIQCSSGAHNRLSDTDLDIYRNYFEEYPNFLGFNFAEQFWDFGKEGLPTFLERLQLLANVLKICRDEGGYLVVSFTQAYWSSEMNPLAYFKRNADMKALLSGDGKDHFVCCEKYTMKNGFYDIESNCLGAYLGGYAGQYGIRFDDSGWASDDVFPRSLGAIPILEHGLLTGQTIIDGPELIWKECIRQVTTSTQDGYTRRNWSFFPQYENVTLDAFRKFIDGTFRIPTRREVIDRTKICVFNDLPASESDLRKPYLTPRTLFDGLYRQDADQGGRLYENHWVDNHWWLKKTGRYPAIPQVAGLLDDDAQSLQIVKVSEYDSRWGNIANKQKELDALFPQRYEGDIYAAQYENIWMTYNPYQYDETTEIRTDESSGKQYMGRVYHLATKRATGELTPLYNTCQKIGFDYAPYSLGVMKEYPDHIDFYLQNYRNTESKQSASGFTEDAQTTDYITIKGASVRPMVEWHDRANHSASSVDEEWKDGVLTLTITHNGPLDLSVKCSGSATSRETEWSKASLEVPTIPTAYQGKLQYEAEHCDYKKVAACRTNGYNYGDANYDYYGQGYVQMGTNTLAALRYPKPVDEAGTYRVTLRYKSAKSATYQVVVDNQSYEVSFPASSTWAEASVDVVFASSRSDMVVCPKIAVDVYLDCFMLENLHTTGITSVSEASNKVVMTEYYDLQGRCLEKSLGRKSGVVVIKRYHADGSVSTVKSIF